LIILAQKKAEHKTFTAPHLLDSTIYRITSGVQFRCARLFSKSFVFLPRGNASPDVALGLVLLQNLFHLEVERPVEGGQALGQILM
jgi:hypothetical protein